ncbi:replication-associated recombination protein A [Schleiferiaceae bacterium]|nr:replication-associated recombination protein A [Schleiferiaceae bacterium]MDB2502922.1 replication-associated recombination protein A [Schleiferiaceae bacterium]MDC0082760.1 replication-associated recombination protein A [Schleiferiaceae bacterium]MDC3237904.1 replication-associated recombination protein A [Schleiferiaceae bacterium]
MKPLAEQLRPQSLDQYLGQEHLVGQNGALRKSLEVGRLPSIVLWGPPGVGKTTLALLLAKELEAPLYQLSAVSAGVKDVREILATAEKKNLFDNKRPILFIDEIHRFNKGQQDSLLHAVERGWITLIGATTENPSFEINAALLSRMQVYVLNSHSKEDLTKMIDLANATEYAAQKDLKITAHDFLIRQSMGDARKLYNLVELCFQQGQRGVAIDEEFAQNVLSNAQIRYDKGGDEHYNVISAFIKSIRGSDPQAAVYYLARMIEGGEDVKFIARRLIISAAEDVGLANPNALMLANETFSAVERVGWPESRIILSQCTIYLATSPKSNSAYTAIGKAQKLVQQTGSLEVPDHLKNASSALAKDLGHGKNYLYPHDHPGGFVPQEYLPKEIQGSVLWSPASNGKEQQISAEQKSMWKDKYEG